MGNCMRHREALLKEQESGFYIKNLLAYQTQSLLLSHTMCCCLTMCVHVSSPGEMCGWKAPWALNQVCWDGKKKSLSCGSQSNIHHRPWWHTPWISNVPLSILMFALGTIRNTRVLPGWPSSQPLHTPFLWILPREGLLADGHGQLFKAQVCEKW